MKRFLNWGLIFNHFLVLVLATVSVFFLINSFSVQISDSYHFYTILGLVVLLSLVYLSLVEFWFIKSGSHVLFRGEQLFLVLTLGFIVTYLSLNKEVAWVIFVLEILTYLVLGSSSIFNRRDYIKSVEASLSYILPSFLSFCVIMLGIFLHQSDLPVPYEQLIVLGLLIKMGAFPFAIWPLQVFQGASYETMVVVAIINKVAIILIVTEYVVGNFHLLTYSGVLSVLFGGILLVNVKEFSKILAISTIISSGWLLVYLGGISYGFSSLVNEDYSYLTGVLTHSKYGILGIYFLFFTIHFVLLTWCVKTTSEESLLFSQNSKVNQLALWGGLVGVVGMSGIPPLASFYFKYLLVYQYSIEEGNLLAFIMLLSSLIGTYAFLRVAMLLSMRLNYDQKSKETLQWNPENRLSLRGSGYYIIFFITSFISFTTLGLLLVLGN